MKCGEILSSWRFGIFPNRILFLAVRPTPCFSWRNAMFRRLILFPSWDEEGNSHSSMQLLRSSNVPRPNGITSGFIYEKDNYCLEVGTNFIQKSNSFFHFHLMMKTAESSRNFATPQPTIKNWHYPIYLSVQPLHRHKSADSSFNPLKTKI